MENMEFGIPPEELKAPDPAREFSSPPPEFPETGPEIVRPGEDPMRSGRRASSRFYMMLLTVVFTFATGAAVTQPADTAIRKHVGGYAAAETLIITDIAYRAEEESQNTGEASEDGQSGETSGGAVYTEPSCEIVLVGMSSEMLGQISFADMDSAELPVLVEYWDPETQTLVYTEEVADVSEPYVLDFSTQAFYDANEAYYDAAGSFPMEAEVTVRFTLQTEEGAQERSFTAHSEASDAEWWVYYNDETDTALYADAQSFVWRMLVYGEAPGVVYAQPELVSEESGVISLLLVADGEAIPAEAVTITDEVSEGDVYGEDGTLTHVDEIHDISVVIPYVWEEGQAPKVSFFVTQYLESLGKVWTLEKRLELE